MCNFRPISLLSLLDKLFEKIICRQVTDQLEQKQILSPSQHGFRQRISWETALLNIMKLLFSARRHCKHSILVTTDFTEAFDIINYDLLLSALSTSGFSYPTIQSFSSNLHNRLQCTRYLNALSPALSLSSGMPYASVVGTIFLLICC